MNKTEIFINSQKEKNWLALAFFFSSFFILFSFIALQIGMRSFLGEKNTLSIEDQTFWGLTFQGILLASTLLPAFLFSQNLSMEEKLKFTNWKISYLPISAAILFLLLPLIAAVSLTVHLVLTKYGFHFETPEAMKLLQKARQPQLSVIIFMMIILAPISEEILFRRVIFGYLEKIMGTTAACIVASALFASFHPNIFTFPSLFILGASFQLLYIKYRSLYPAVLLHALNNTVSSVFILIMSG
jgi:membrane protease YdiL (CAAX protease family)